MKLLLLITLAFTCLYSANILSYNIYDRTDRVDIMFTFDTPFTGTITQKRHNDKLIVKLNNSSIESPKIKNITSKFVSKLTIAPIGDEVQVIAKVPQNVIMKASKTSDGYGLRLRFMTAIKPAIETLADTPYLTQLPTKPDMEISTSYFVVIILLFVSILALLIFKKRLGNASTTNKTFSLFKKNPASHDEVAIRFQKSIDANNKVVMLEFAQEKYLVVLGNTNLLLDKFDTSNIRSKHEFEEMLDTKHQELDQFLKIKKESEAFESYKDKASGIDAVIDDLDLKKA